MYQPPTWLKLTAVKVRTDSRLMPHMLMAAADEAAMDADITNRIPTQAGIVMRRINTATRPLGTGYQLTDDQKDSIIEAVKLKVISAITATEISEVLVAVSKAAKNEANEIISGLEDDFEQLAKSRLKTPGAAGSSRFSRGPNLERSYLDNLMREHNLPISCCLDDE